MAILPDPDIEIQRQIAEHVAGLIRADPAPLVDYYDAGDTWCVRGAGRGGEGRLFVGTHIYGG